MAESLPALLSQLGFRFGINGPHAARTMMLSDLRQLFSSTPADASRAEYASAILDDNVLGKPTRKSRTLALRHLATLYGLQTANPVFRALRRLWPLNEEAQPMLALAVALARDPLLASTQDFLLALPVGCAVQRESVAHYLEHLHPGRFSPASLQSFAQNVAGTWTDAGFLHGRRRKVRSIPKAHPESLTLLLFLGYLMGRSGQRLFASEWTQLLDCTQDELELLASTASRRGLLVFMHAGGVQEVRFPGYLTPEEEKLQQEVAHVL